MMAALAPMWQMGAHDPAPQHAGGQAPGMSGAEAFGSAWEGRFSRSADEEGGVQEGQGEGDGSVAEGDGQDYLGHKPWNRHHGHHHRHRQGKPGGRKGDVCEEGDVHCDHRPTPRWCAIVGACTVQPLCYTCTGRISSWACILLLEFRLHFLLAVHSLLNRLKVLHVTRKRGKRKPILTFRFPLGQVCGRAGRGGRPAAGAGRPGRGRRLVWRLRARQRLRGCGRRAASAGAARAAHLRLPLVGLVSPFPMICLSSCTTDEQNIVLAGSCKPSCGIADAV